MSSKIYAQIPKVMAEVGAIGKSGTNDFDKYKFRTIDDVYNKLQPVLAKNSVFLVPTVLESHEDRFKSKNGTEQVRVKLKVKYMIYADDGSSIEAVVEGEAIDRSDKATNKALTAAFKYLLIQIFCLAVEGLEDADSSTPELNFVPEQKHQDLPQPKALPADFKIADGRYRGKRISDIDGLELEKYISQIEAAAKEGGKNHPKWFVDLKKAVNL